MKMQNKKWLALILSLVLGLMMLAGCSTTTTDDATDTTDEGTQVENTDDSKGTVKLVYVNWAEGVAMTSLATAILEDMGYEVEMTMADVAPIFTALANGDQDAFMDSWLPVTHASYIEEYGDDLADLGLNYSDAKLGLVVPSYMDINSIEELNSVKDDLNGEITGIDSGAGMMAQTEVVIEEYGLDLDLIPSSGPAMTAALGAAIDANESIVVTGWAPHWMFAKWDLKILEDPKLIFGDAENIHTIARKDLATDMPEVAAFLENFFMDAQQLGDLMGAIADSDEDSVVVAKAWMEDNMDLVETWIPAE